MINLMAFQPAKCPSNTQFVLLPFPTSWSDLIHPLTQYSGEPTYVRTVSTCYTTLCNSPWFYSSSRPAEGVPPRAAAARVLALPVPDAGGRHGRLPARRPGRQRKARLLHPRLSSKGQQSKEKKAGERLREWRAPWEERPLFLLCFCAGVMYS